MPPTELFRLVVLAAIWGSSFLFMQQLMPTLGALPTSFFRALVAAIGLLAWMALWRQRSLGLRGHMPRLLLLGCLNSALPVLMYALALHALPTGYVVILNATVPLMAVLLGPLFGEHADARKWAGVLLGTLGVAVLVRSGPVPLNPMVGWSVLACLCATASYAVAGFLTQRWLRAGAGLDSRSTALGSQIGAVIVLAPLLLWPGVWGSEGESLRMAWSSPALWLSLCALGLGCTSVAFLLYFRLIERTGLLRAQCVTFLIPLFGVVWGASLLGEQLSWAHPAGGLMVLLASGLILWPGRHGGEVTQCTDPRGARP